MEDNYFVIEMTTETGIQLYYSAVEGGFKWDKRSVEGIWFDTPQDAEAFAEQRFTRFKGWKVVPVTYDHSTDRTEVGVCQ